MNNGNGFRQKLRYGSISAAITAGVLVAVLLLNIVFSALSTRGLWFVDLTSENLYGFSDDAYQMLSDTLEAVNATREEDDAVTVDIVFCADPDILCQTEMMRYIYYTALRLQKIFPDTVRVVTTDVWDNPSSVDAYRTTSYSTIYPSNIIVASGTEFRIYSIDSFYIFDSNTSTTPWAYKGEQVFLQAIIAVTKAEAPVCVLTTNHGEPFATEEGKAEYSAFLNAIESAGYEICFLDLEREAIPEKCRLIITFDPQSDFSSDFTGGESSELGKLDSFLKQAYSFMIFADADTPELPNLEEILEEWGISFMRHTTDAGETATSELVDPGHAIDADGLRLIGQFEQEGLGGSTLKNIRELGNSPKVIFENALAISYSPTYQRTYVLPDTTVGSGAFSYGSYFSNGIERAVYDLFRSGKDSYAYAKYTDGTRVKDSGGNDLVISSEGGFSLMTLTRENRLIGEGQGYTSVNDASYVCAVGSTEFASNAYLGSNSYGNTDTLLAVLRAMGREVVPVGIEFNVLYDDMIASDYDDRNSANTQTVVFMVLPAVVMTVAGVCVLTRRRNRH